MKTYHIATVDKLKYRVAALKSLLGNLAMHRCWMNYVDGSIYVRHVPDNFVIPETIRIAFSATLSIDGVTGEYVLRIGDCVKNPGAWDADAREAIKQAMDEQGRKRDE